jgi:hypothetical protein
MIKSTTNQNTDVVTTKLKQIWLVLRRGGFFFFWGVVVCSLGGKSWDGEEEGEIEEEMVGRVVIYSLLPMESPTDSFSRWFHRQFWRRIGHVTVRRSGFESLNDFVVKITRKKFHVSELLFLFWIFCRYILTVVFRRYIPTELRTE